MRPLTAPMLQILREADLERGTLNNVPLGTAQGLHDRGLIYWRNGAYNTERGSFPRYYGVRLTPEGLAMARRQSQSKSTEESS